MRQIASRKVVNDHSIFTIGEAAMDNRFKPSRRQLMKAGLYAAGTTLVPGIASAMQRVMLPIENGERELIAYPEKRPLIVLTARPPQLETPFSVFNEGVITPNDAFFVRYHLANIPTAIDPDAFRLAINGAVKPPLSLSLPHLRSQFETAQAAAVHRCPRNLRGVFNPRDG